MEIRTVLTCSEKYGKWSDIRNLSANVGAQKATTGNFAISSPALLFFFTGGLAPHHTITYHTIPYLHTSIETEAIFLRGA